MSESMVVSASETSVPDRSVSARDRRRRLGVIGAVVTLALGIALAVTALIGGYALAASYQVTTPTDAADANPGDGVCATAAGECTLRAAIQEANSTLAADSIVVPPALYTLTVAPEGDNLTETGDLDVLRPVTITGAGPGATVLDGGAPLPGAAPGTVGLDRLLELHSGAGNVTIAGLTLREGSDPKVGGALLNGSSGTVRLQDVTVRDSFATEAGGAIYTGGNPDCVDPCVAGRGRLELVDSTVSGSSTEGEGGGIHTSTSTLSVVRSEISGNRARGGGGIYNDGELSPTGTPSRVELDEATVSGNVASGGGGGVANDGEGQLTVRASTITQNTTDADGGGLYSGSKAGVTITGGTFTGNRSHGQGGGAYSGGERAARIEGTRFADNAAGAPVIENGVPVAGESGGGGLAVSGDGPVTITGATFERNTAVGDGGGVLLANNTTVQFTDSVLRGNRTESGGGGLENSAARVTLTRLQITDNRAGLDGGGVQSNGSGEFTLAGTTLARNTAENGGGLANQADGALRVLGSTIWDNRALTGANDDTGLGGGVYGLGDADAAYENTTITANFAQVRGGGLYVDSDAGVRVSNATISGNSAPVASGVGGEITSINFPVEPSRSVLFRNTVVAANLLSPSCNYALGSQGGNLEDGNSCYFRGPRDRIDAASAGLNAVADNGGPTLTVGVLPDSFVVDGGVSPCPATDQRGVARPQNSQCDIGAVEFEGPFRPQDDTPPDTAYLTGPVMDTESTSVFTFTGRDDVTPASELLYECRLLETDPTEPPEPVDPTEPVPPEEMFVGCPNPWQVPLVEAGQFRFEVRAVDRAGRVDPTPAVHVFGVADDVTPPQTTFAEKPPNPSPTGTATFTFSGTDAETPAQFLEFECRIDSADPLAWRECVNPTSFSNLTPGPHTVQVRATDLNDNVDPSPATHTWTVAPPADCDAANITLFAAEDAHVDEGITVQNFGTAEELVVRSAGPGADARSLIRFTLPTGGQCTIESATLRLHGEGEAGRTLQATPLDGPWSESQVTWNNQPAATGTPVGTTSGAGYREWNVTGQVAAMLRGAPNHGWQIRDALEDDATGAEQGFVSSEAVVEPPTPPQLVLRFAAAGTPPPAAPPAPGAAETVTCGQVLTTSTKLANDLIDCPGEGLVIGAPNIVVDLNGRTVDSGVLVEPGEEDGLLAGVRNSGHSNVVVRNGTIKDFGYGVRLMAGTTYNVVEDLTLRGNVNAGVELFDADNGRNGNVVRDSEFLLNGIGVALTTGAENSAVTGNTFTGNLGVAVYLFDATGHRIEGNRVSGLTGDPLLDSDGGLRLESSNGNRLIGNTVADTGDAGFDLSEGSSRNRIEGNTASRTSDSAVTVSGGDGNEIVDNVAHLAGGEGISLGDVTGGAVTGNDVRFNPGGVALSGSRGVLVQDNDATGSGAGGITVEAGGAHRIVANTANGTNGTGIAVEGETGGNVIERNTANDNSGDGISVGGAGHTVTGNATHNNLGWGIDAAAGTVDGDGNTASGNAEALQCTGVVCGRGTPVPPAAADIVPPETRLLSTPPNPSGSMSTATFTFAGTDDVAPATALRFECRLDAPPDPPVEPPDPPEPGEPPNLPEGENWVECLSGISYPFLPSGTHTFEVRAIDPSGLFDGTPAVHTWTVVPAAPGPDPTPPSTTLATAPTDPSSATTATFAFRGQDNVTPGPSLTYACRLDSGPFTACTSPVSYPGLALGAHRFEVRATDLAGNTDPSPAVHAWTRVAPAADTTAPETRIDSGPDATTVATAATVRFSSVDDPTATFQCALDGTSYQPCTSPRTYAGLAVGPHTVLVRARDAAGNVDATPARFAWTVTAPPVDTTVSCGQVLTRSTRVLNDLIDCPGDGLVIGADGITVDLDGATIDGVAVGAGVRNAGFDSVTITNGFVQQFESGVALDPGTARGIVSSMTVQLAKEAGLLLTNADDSVDGNTVRDNVLTGNAAGIWLLGGTQGALLRGNSVGGSSGFGIHVQGSGGNRIEGNDVSGSSDAGLSIEGSVGNALIRNTLDGNADAALVVELGSHDTLVEGNTVTASEAGINVADSNGPRILANVFTGSSDSGISLENAQNGELRDNDVRFNAGGIELYGSSGHRVEGNDAGEGGTGIELGDESLRNEIVRNSASGNDSEGISVGGQAAAGSGNLIEANTADGNSADGIFIGAVGHMIRGNTANDNGGWGIYAAEGTVAGVNVDGGGNRAVGNVGGGIFNEVTQTSEQCYNIRCDGGPGLPVDRVEPETVLAQGPPDPTTATSAGFRFDGSDNASSVRFECRLDSAAFAACTSPVTLSGLGLGTHTFEIRAIDFSGNVDTTPVRHQWRVQAEPPGVPPETTVGSGPDSATVSTAASFTFSSNEQGARFECALDTAPFASCTSPAGYSALAVGSHTFRVRAVDAENLVDASPAVYGWTVGAPPVNATVRCGQVLTRSTRVLNDLTDCPGDGLVIGANGITVDLNGRVVDGIGQGTGVRNDSFDAATVTNGAVQEFDSGVGWGADRGILSALTLTLHQVAGVGLSDADGTTVRGTTLTGNKAGILLANGTQDARVTGNSLSDNPGPGIRVENSAGNRIEGNQVSESSEDGVVLEGSDTNTVLGNTLTGNDKAGVILALGSDANRVETNTVAITGSTGIAVTESAGTQLVGNTVSRASDNAISLDAANGGVVRGNDVRGNPGGIELSESSGNRIENNNASAASGTGISLDGGSLDNDVVGNQAGGNSGEGIYVADQAAGGAGNLIENNRASNNSGDGISVNAAIHTIRGNTVDSNDGWGILAVSGNIDGGGNRAAGNAEPQQCSGVVCAIGPAPGAPDTTLVERPPNPSSSRNALFTFTGSDDTTTVGNLEFECRLDSTSDAAWVECENPATYANLAPGRHVFEVRAVDSAELVDPSPARYEWEYRALPPGVAPATTIGLAPAPVTPLYEALFTFTANEPDVRFECSLDGAAYQACAFAFEHEFEETQAGPHTFRVRAIDAEGNVGAPATYNWTVLGVVTTITSGPAYEPGQGTDPAGGGETEDTTATFTFEANVADATFLCSLDLGPFVPCTSPRTYTGLAVGEHILRIVATDPEGREEMEPAEYGWEVLSGLDVVPPNTQITAGPAEGSTSDQATFTFAGTDNVTAPAGLTFECRLDDPLPPDHPDATWAECASPYTYPNPDLPEPLAAGGHRFEVRAVDAEDNIDPSPAGRGWTFTADTTAPTVSIAAGPPATTPLTEANFTFSANDPFAVFECAVDGAPFEPCQSPLPLQSLEPGPHEVAVRATDLTGNLGAPATYAWTVVGAPVTTILTSPAATTPNPAASFTFRSDQPGSTFQCSLDGAPFGPCSSPVTYTGLAVGEHGFAVQARNSFGMTEAAPVEFGWTVEPTPPDTTVTTRPGATTAQTAATFAFAADQAGSTFRCSLDGAPFVGCTSPVTYTNLTVGAHTFSVAAVDPGGEIDPTPAAYGWQVVPPPDTTPPDTTVTSAPPASTTSTSATIAFGATEAGSTFRCALDAAAFTPCTSPHTVTGLAPGQHQLRVHAVDPAANPDPSPATVSWTVQAQAASCPTTPITATANADSWILQDSARQNYGNDSVLKIDSKSGANARALVRFGLPAIPAGCQIQSAQLRLNASSAKTGRTLQALPVTGAWTEGGVTWANQPPVGTPAATTASGSGYRQWTVTGQVQGMYSGANHGFLIRDAVENGGGVDQNFRGRTEGSNPPQLVITLAPTTPPPTTTTPPPPPTTTTTTPRPTTTAPPPTTTTPRPTTTTPPPTTPTTTTPPPSGCRTTSVTTVANRDSWIDQKDLNKNLGTDSVLKLRTKSGENTRALIGFALPATPTGCQIVGAQLRVHNGSPKSGHTVQVFGLNGAWTENAVTWRNAPGTTGPAATATTPGSAGTMAWNVTGQVQAMSAGQNHGFLLRAATENGNGDEQAFNSREKAPDNPPQLVITYGPAS